jgi:hypothetical protein
VKVIITDKKVTGNQMTMQEDWERQRQPEKGGWSCFPCFGFCCPKNTRAWNHEHNDEVLEGFDAYRTFVSVVLPAIWSKNDNNSPLQMIDVGPVNHIMDLISEYVGVPQKNKIKSVLWDLQYALKWFDMPEGKKRDRIQWRNLNKNLKMATVLECNEFDLEKSGISKRGKKGGCWYGKKRPRSEISM